MASKYNRDNFYKQNVVDDILQFDLVMNYWELFEIKSETRFFTITRSYIARPDLLSLKLYGSMDFWWIIAKVNNIEDWFNDIEVGDVIQVPDIRDIEEFYIKVRNAKKKE